MGRSMLTLGTYINTLIQRPNVIFKNTVGSNISVYSKITLKNILLHCSFKPKEVLTSAIGTFIQMYWFTI